jgi:hypothetical protein
MHKVFAEVSRLKKFLNAPFDLNDLISKAYLGSAEKIICHWMPA